MALQKTILKQYGLMGDRGWDTIYWCIDFHGTIKPSSYSTVDGTEDYYEGAIEALKKISNRKDSRLILWTSSYRDYLEPHIKYMKELGVTFDYVNDNPECTSNKISNFAEKLYFNVLVDDKAGFDPEEDWEMINKVMDEIDVRL